MGKQAKLRAKRRELRVYVNQASITPAEANEAMRRAKKQSKEKAK